MMCSRCGSEVADGAPQCTNCGQRLARAPKTLKKTTTSFRALENRRLRAAKIADQRRFAIGDVVRARYEVRDVLGAGPLGVVYRVHDQEIECDVALKVIHSELLVDAETRESFHKTIRRVRKLSQQNIVRLYDEDVHGDSHFFTVQLLEGMALRKLIHLRREKGEPFKVREAEPILGQVAMALSHAHRHTVHGNLKPENVIVLPDVIKLTDFSAHEWVPISAFVDVQKKAGRSHYSAPELLAGGPVDARADIYSLGALLYEMLTNRGFSPGGPAVSELGTSLEGADSGAIDELVTRATATDPRDRFASVEQFSEALGTYIDVEEISSVEVSVAGLSVDSDVTQRISVPEVLRDDDATATGERLAAPPSGAVEPERSVTPMPVVEAEQSFVEELSEADLIEAQESVDLRTELPELSTPQEVDVGVESDDPDDLASAPVDTKVPIAVAAQPQGPWFLRSNLGLLAAIVVILCMVASVAALVLYLLPEPRRKQVVTYDGGTLARATVGRTDAGAAVSLDAATRPDPDVAVVEATADAATPLQPDVRSAGVTIVQPQPPTVEVEPARSRVPPSDRGAKHEAPKPTEPAPVKPPEPAPVKPPEPEPVKPPEPAPVKPPASASTSADEDKPSGAKGPISCPAGMKLVTRGRFPKGSVRGATIKGAKAVAMARDGKAFCVDPYEYPGRKRKPKTSVSFNMARNICESAGKRLCASSEWKRACRGRRGAPYPYGKEFNPALCNTEDDEGDERSLTASGRFRKCRGAWGTYDMSGNAAEWTQEQAVRGGDYASSDEDASCSGGGGSAPGTKRANIGFRCCADLK